MTLLQILAPQQQTPCQSHPSHSPKHPHPSTNRCHQPLTPPHLQFPRLRPPFLPEDSLRTTPLLFSPTPLPRLCSCPCPLIVHHPHSLPSHKQGTQAPPHSPSPLPIPLYSTNQPRRICSLLLCSSQLTHLHMNVQVMRQRSRTAALRCRQHQQEQEQQNRWVRAHMHPQQGLPPQLPQSHPQVVVLLLPMELLPPATLPLKQHCLCPAVAGWKSLSQGCT
mmetsp:Transcript_4172/g.11276  ORF Transcript_4172/g.11276 Transcript_4172/m.11276 type:complete len:221 (-) Transcript_4172:498-1160(-)